MAAASFEFVQSTERLDWGVLVAIDLQRLIKDTNVDTLQRIVENLAFARVTRDEAAMFTPEHILHLFTLCQLVIQYLVNSQECLAKINVRLTERLQEMQHRGETAEAERERLHEENVVLRKEVKAQRRTLLAYEYANTTAAGGGGGMSTVGGGHLYVCQQCGDSYAKKESLQSHVRKRHGMVKKETSSFQPQQQQQGNDVCESQAEQQRQLKEKVEKLESLLEREKERNDRIQRDSMMMMMQATMSGAARAPTPTSTTSAAPAAANTATASFSSVSAPPPQQQQQTLQEPLARLPHVHSLPLQVSPEITAIPVMPDVAALQRYNTTRQQEAANNALLRKVSELEALVSDLKTTKKEATQTRAAPPPPPPEPTVPTTTTTTAAAAVQAAALSSQTQQKPQQQQQSQPSRSSHTPSWLTAPGVAPPGPHVTPASAPSLAMKSASVPSSSSVNAPQQPNQQQQQQAGVSAPLAAVTPPLSLPPPPPPPPPQQQQRQPQLPQPELQPQPQPQLPPQQPQPIKQESPQLAQAKPVPVPIPLSATAPGSSGSTSTNFSYVSSHYNSVTKNTPLTAPSSSTQSVNVAPPNGKDASSSLASDTLLAKYGPPGPAIVPKSMPRPSLQQTTKTETVSAQGSVPVWLPSNSHPDDSMRGSLNLSSIPQSNANPVPRTTDTTVAAPTLSPPRVQSNSLASADPYPTVQGTIPKDPQNVSQQQTAPPPMEVGLDPRLGGAPHSQHPVPVPLGPSYSTGVIMSAAGVPHAAVPVVKKFNADNGGSYFESSTSSDSS